MRHVLALILALAGTAPAFADGNGGPQAPNSEFLIWQKQGADSMRFSSPSALSQQAHPTEMANTTPKTVAN